MRRISTAVACFASLLFAACLTCCFLRGGALGDPVRTTRQTVRLRLVNSADGSPVAGLNMQVKKDFARSDGLSPRFQRESEDYQQHLREWWETLPWFPCVTD